ncbi:hypothetical protein [Streptomyces boluensis]|uniref:Lipoprotein n=1 Tax=Streptomyces boluensis TaxID=1775135 RepID=A0A964XL57_9ACTN|nr:hypothetical protein [Streptomyces boluensis]NBE51248.1 hypothetical protein [Streptomyces boluensis]
MLKHVRICAAAAAVATALVLTGCSSDDGGKRKTDNSSSGEAGQDTSGGTTGGSDGAEAGPGSLDGLWVSVTNGTSVALSVQQGGKVAVLAEMGVGETTGVTCVGKAGAEAGGQTIALKCQGGGKREMGTIDSVDATSMKVTWAGVGTDSFKKSDESKLPEGLPTGMPEGMPQG